jgi:hypothetical protein
MPNDGSAGVLPGPHLAALAPLARELRGLARIRDATSPDSLASRLFRRAWAALIAGEAPADVALGISADALAACRLHGIDAALLATLGFGEAERFAVLARAFDAVAAPLSPALCAELREMLGQPMPPEVGLPGFVDALARQPCHAATGWVQAEHCLVAAVLGVVLGGAFAARPHVPFLAGLAHRLAYATLPDIGAEAEMLLGEHLQPLKARLLARELATLSRPLAEGCRDALASTAGHPSHADVPRGE